VRNGVDLASFGVVVTSMPRIEKQARMEAIVHRQKGRKAA
jgi:hypothetical protein